jgi:hypothetical protein
MLNEADLTAIHTRARALPLVRSTRIMLELALSLVHCSTTVHKCGRLTVLFVQRREEGVDPFLLHGPDADRLPQRHSLGDHMFELLRGLEILRS